MTPEAGDRPLTVGAVVAALAPEFPDVTISKVRFLESEGLVTPARTASGYRQFSAADVERIRFVLHAQRDRFWPLKVIREALAGLDRGLVLTGDDDPTPRPPTTSPDAASRLPSPAAGPLRLTPAELAEASGLTPEAVADLVAHGVLRPDHTGHHGEADLEAARAAAGLAAYGVEARHLRAFRAAADREAGLVEQAVGGRRGPAADRGAAEVAELCLALHGALLRGGLTGRAG